MLAARCEGSVAAEDTAPPPSGPRRPVHGARIRSMRSLMRGSVAEDTAPPPSDPRRPVNWGVEALAQAAARSCCSRWGSMLHREERGQRQGENRDSLESVGTPGDTR